MPYGSALAVMVMKYIYDTVLRWFWTNRRCVGIDACLNSLNLLLDAWCTIKRPQLHTCLLFKYTKMAMTHFSVSILMLIEYMERYRVIGHWANRKYVAIGARLHLHLWLLDIRWTMTPLQLHTRLLYDNNGNGIRLCGVDGTYGTASCWLCTNRKYVCFGIGVCLIWINHYWCTVHYKNITIAHWSAMQMHYKWQCVITWCKMHHDTTGSTQSTPIQLQFQWPTVSRWYIFASYSNTFQRWSHMPHGSTLMPMLVEYIYCVYMERRHFRFGQTVCTSVFLI